MQIQAIDAVDNFKYEDDRYNGFRIITSSGDILIGVSNCRSEGGTWGCDSSIDELEFEEFIGSRVSSVKKSSTCISGEEFAGAKVFINVETDMETLQFYCYNEDDGFHNHTAVVIIQGELLLKERL